MYHFSRLLLLHAPFLIIGSRNFAIWIRPFLPKICLIRFSAQLLEISLLHNGQVISELLGSTFSLLKRPSKSNMFKKSIEYISGQAFSHSLWKSSSKVFNISRLPDRIGQFDISSSITGRFLTVLNKVITISLISPISSIFAFAILKICSHRVKQYVQVRVFMLKICSSWLERSFRKYCAGIGDTTSQFLKYSQNSTSHSVAFLIAIGFGCKAHRLMTDPLLMKSELYRILIFFRAI